MNINISILRIIAFTLVFIYHLFPTKHQYFFIGVDLFLVLTGYLLSSKINRNLKKINRIKLFKEIFIERIKKLFIPLSIFLIIFTIPLIAFFPYPIVTVKSSLYSILFIQNIALIKNSFNYFDNGNLDFFNHLWYLSVDFQVLLFISVIVILFLKKKLINFTLFFSFLISFFYYHINHINNNYISTYFNSFARAWEILAGYLIFLAINHSFKHKKLIPIILILIGLLLIYYDPFNKNYLFTSLTVIFGCLYLSIQKYWPKVKNNMISNIINNCSSLTYYGYLTHYPIILINRVLFNESLTIWLSIIFTLIFSLLIRKLSNLVFFNKLSSFRNLFLLLLALWFPFILTILKSSYSTNKIAGLLSKNQQKIPKFKNEECIIMQKVANNPNWLDSILNNCFFENKIFNKEINDDKVVFIGDSHALEYAKIFSKIESNFKKTYFIAGVDVFQLSNDKEFVALFFDNIKRYFGKDDVNYYITFYAQRMKENKDLADRVNKGVDNILEYLSKNNMQNYFLIDYPLQCSKKNFYKSFVINNFDSCKEESLLFKTNNVTYFKFINYLKNKYKNKIIFRDPSNYICSQEECNLTINGNLIFYDTAIHLNNDGIEYIKNKLPSKFFF